MGITSALVQQVGSRAKIKMLRLSVVLLLPALIVASPEAEPSGYGGGCQTTYDTVYTKVCATSYDKRCQQSAQTEYDTKCETTYLKNCFPVPRKVPDKECFTEYDQVCTKNSKTTIETRTDTQCKDIIKKVCSDVRVEVGPVVPGPTKVAAVAVGYGASLAGAGLAGAGLAGAGLAGKGLAGGYHKREAEASGYGAAPKCQEVRDRQCKQIPISIPRTVEVPVCKKVPRTVCNPTYKVVLDTKCQ